MLTALRRVLVVVTLGLGLLGSWIGPASAQSSGTVLVATVDGIINPVVADYVSRVIEHAEQRDAALLVLQVNTPGGLDTSMRQIIQRILGARVPVAVYVAPQGARAGSAGVYITYAAHVAAMAPNTNIGSATPVMMGEGGEAKLSDEMRAKVTNDAVAYIRSLAEQRGRNVDWAERAVRLAVNVSATEAAEQRIVDFKANDLSHLLELADGRTVEVNGSPIVLATRNAPVERLEMSPIESFLHVISNPTIAYILLSLGSLGLMLELYNPGQVLPGIVGGICLLLAFYALGTLPVNYAGLLLIGFALLLFVAEVFSPTHGILAAGAVISFVLGSLLLFNAPDNASFLRVSLPVIVGMALFMGASFVFVFGAIARTRRRRVVTGREGLLGQVVPVRSRLAPVGYVLAESELWRATTSGRAVEVGERVRITAVDGLRLTVAPLEAQQPDQPVAVAPAEQRGLEQAPSPH